MKDSEPNSDVEQRVAILIDHFSYSLYRNVCRSLFEKDKLLYSFLVCTRLMISLNKIRADELRFLLSGVGGVLTGKQPDKPADWVPDRTWTETLQASQLASFANFPAMFTASLPEWLKLYDSTDPAAMPMPGGANERFNAFQKICILRCLRPDKVVPVVQQLVIDEMGQRFVEPPPVSSSVQCSAVRLFPVFRLFFR